MKDKFDIKKILIITVFIGLILTIFGLLSRNNPVETFNTGKSEITIINLTKKTEFNYLLITGVALIFISLSLFFLENLKNNKVDNLTELTAKEKQIFNLIKEGKTNKEIATELFISLSTVKTHINNIFKKLNITKRQELIAKFKRD